MLTPTQSEFLRILSSGPRTGGVLCALVGIRREDACLALDRLVWLGLVDLLGPKQQWALTRYGAALLAERTALVVDDWRPPVMRVARDGAGDAARLPSRGV